MDNIAMRAVQANLFFKEKTCIEDMKIIQGDTALAKLQGFIDGAQKVRDLLQEAGFEIIEDCEIIPRDFISMTIEDLHPFYNDAADILDGSQWADFLEESGTEESKKKEFLYSDECTKGRDLFFVHGWKDAVQYMRRNLQLIIDIYEKLRATSLF